MKLNAMTVCFIVVTITASINAAPLSDSEAKTIVQDAFASGRDTIYLGVFNVINDTQTSLGQKADIKNRTIDSQYYTYLKGWEKAGVVNIILDKQYEDFKSGKNFSWGNFLQSGTEGIQSKIVVQLTEKGERIAGDNGSYKTNGFVKVSEGTFTIKDVVKNEEKNDGVDECRVLMLTYNAAWTPEYLTVAQAFGTILKEQRKAMILLKYDPFAKKWEIRALDIANADGDFTTQNVSLSVRNFH
jgi:hypothetical protein